MSLRRGFGSPCRFGPRRISWLSIALDFSDVAPHNRRFETRFFKERCEERPRTVRFADRRSVL